MDMWIFDAWWLWLAGGMLMGYLVPKWLKEAK